ncbi:carboxypeptidase S [Dacryopinax primogenitus]|uniref:Carboxypeptidase S n=1 Tax=Dacryopinax primogenitus (strain DJM 731) TaxID=1858805 RepID=M5G3Z5_DACPD|nr:carboxypeptidase S [Dacryopinax primogenitus]EJT98482.1 carboxypeptidase S [Dacryopinax primogenitus]
MDNLNEKGDLLPSATGITSAPKRSLLWQYAKLAAVCFTVGYILCGYLYPATRPLSIPTFGCTKSAVSVCAQSGALKPSNEALLNALYEQFADPVFVNKSAELLGASVRIPTEMYDGLGEVGEDDRWEKFGAFHAWLEGAFPNVHATFKKETVNTWGLVYTWKGSDGSLKPLMLTGHQDVVPVEPQTYDQWTHPPFSGYFDGEWIWGRGSCDDKGGLMAIMIAMETLLKKGFVPKRTVLLAFGFDEEVSGMRGAASIGNFLLETYGENSMAMLIDEGAGYSEIMGAMYAAPGVGEKGAIDARLAVKTKGGHSSTPPKHTGIGILSSLVTSVEANPIPPRLTRSNPFYSTLQCIAEYSPELPKKARHLIRASQKSDNALEKLGEWAMHELPAGVAVLPIGPSLMSTTQAVDLIHGGVKSNALPEQAYAVINHRVSVSDSLAVVQDHLVELLGPQAAQWNLSMEGFGAVVSADSDDAPKAGSLVLSDTFGTALEPAPVSPVEGAVWNVLGGTIKTVYAHNDGLPASIRRAKLESGEQISTEINMAPGIMSGNTDTRHYWGLTPHIFRYAHNRPEGIGNGFHTVNEAMGIENFMAAIEFFTTLAMNVDEANL